MEVTVQGNTAETMNRKSILRNAPSLLSLRKHSDPNSTESDDFMVLSLKLRYMKFRVSICMHS